MVLVLLSACALSMGPLGDTILNFSFMSMGLRGATVFLPLCFAIFFSGAVPTKYAKISMVCGPLTVLLFELWSVLPFDSLFAGVLVSAFIMLSGMIENHLQK